MNRVISYTFALFSPASLGFLTMIAPVTLNQNDRFGFNSQNFGRVLFVKGLNGFGYLLDIRWRPLKHTKEGFRKYSHKTFEVTKIFF